MIQYHPITYLIRIEGDLGGSVHLDGENTGASVGCLHEEFALLTGSAAHQTLA